MPKRRVLSPEAISIAQMMDEDVNDIVIMNRIECGLHSGFPLCCVVFFVKVWGPFVMDVDDADRALSESYHAWLSNMECSVGYVPCPKCVIDETFVKVKSCDCTKRRRDR